MRQALTYDDIQLIPNFSAVQSRQDIKLHTNVSRNWSIDIPIVGSCMDTVTELEIASTQWKWVESVVYIDLCQLKNK